MDSIEQCAGLHALKARPDDLQASASSIAPRKRTRRLTVVGPSLVAALTAGLLPFAAIATEGGATNKALGVDTVLPGVMPPPGMRLTSYLGYYTADQTLDGSGNPRPGISNFKIDAAAFTTRFQYVWSDAKLWGADIETRVGLTWFADVDLHLDVQTPGGKIHRSGSENDFLPGGLLAPALLGWHGETVHQVTGLEIFFPGREYQPAQVVNVSSGYWSVAPAYWITWFPTEATEVSGSLVYLYNFKNDNTNYLSGQEVNLDYGLGYAVTPTWQVGLNGYLYKQVTDDEVNGVAVPGGNKGQAVAVGPFIRYHPSKNFGITFKWQHEYLVENRASGNRFFLQISAQLW